VNFIGTNVSGANFTGTNLTGKINFAEAAIRRYLEQQPEGTDTVEDIHRFWVPWGEVVAVIPDPMVPTFALASPVVTTIALERLEAAGLVGRLLNGDSVLWRGSRQTM
jgi:uncharacterized protein YjbI with pentapeptide repeats